jgi:hypothetical protein
LAGIAGQREERHLVELLGNVKLIELEVRDVDFALGKLAKLLSTRSIRLARMILIRTDSDPLARRAAVLRRARRRSGCRGTVTGS